MFLCGREGVYTMSWVIFDGLNNVGSNLGSNLSGQIIIHAISHNISNVGLALDSGDLAAVAAGQYPRHPIDLAGRCLWCLIWRR